MIRNFKRAILGLAAAFLAASAGFHYRAALPGYRYAFPRDHFEHPDFRTEWWYYTGNLRSAEGKRFGFELVFFRRGERRGPLGKPPPRGLRGVVPGPLAPTPRGWRGLLSP